MDKTTEAKEEAKSAKPVDGDKTAGSAEPKDERKRNSSAPEGRRKKRRNYDSLDQQVPEDQEEPENDGESSEDEPDDLQEIDTSNIITGRRTRGRVVDYKRADAESRKAGEAANADDEDDDEEFNV